MKNIRSLGYLVIVATLLSSLLAPLSFADNSLTDAEASDGWALLFNGQDMDQWRNFKTPNLSDKWVVENGVMTLTLSLIHI